MASVEADPQIQIPKLALRVEQAAESLSVSPDYLRKKVLPKIRVVRDGRTKLIPVSELVAYLDSQATQTDW